MVRPREEVRGPRRVAGASWVDDRPDDAVLASAPDQASVELALTHDPGLDDLALLEDHVVRGGVPASARFGLAAAWRRMNSASAPASSGRDRK